MVLYGEGQNGKSTIATAISNVLGRELCGAAGLEELADNKNYVLGGLRDKLLNIGGELRADEAQDSANFKKICSGDTIITRNIYEKPIDDVLACKLMFLSNHLPRFRNGSYAEARRLIIVAFNRCIEVPDQELPEKLKLETSGILNWMLEGLQWLLLNRRIPGPGLDSCNEMSSFELYNDPVGEFLRTLVVGADRTISKDEFREGFKDWCSDQGISSEHLENSLFKLIRKRFPEVTTKRLRIGNATVRTPVLVGITLKSKVYSDRAD